METVKTTVWVRKGDYEWAVRIATKHGISIDAITRIALANLRAMVIAELITVDQIKEYE